MKAVRKKKPAQVSGYVIRVSVLKMIGMMAVATVLSLVGLGMVVYWFATEGASIWVLTMGLLMLVFGPAGVGLGIYQLKVKERLIVAADRFQIIHRVQGEDEVVTQIPYSNISKITCERGSQRNHVGIDLAELDRPETYQKSNNFETIKSVNGFHCVIYEGYTEALETIYEMLKARLEEYEAAHGR
jgi:hypothetical protein